MKTLTLTGLDSLLSLLILACLPTLGTASVGAGADTLPQAPPQREYRICSGDSLSIVVWGEDRFSQECEVNSAGTISYSLLGDVTAVGLTCAELQDRLQAGLRKYLTRPLVIVTIRQYGSAGTSIFVLGEVKNPGVYPLASGANLMQSLAVAGGPTALASGEVTIVKARTGELRTFGLEQATIGARPTRETLLEQGDVVMVKRRSDADHERRYSVLGEVPTPGMFDMPLDRDVRVLDALQHAGLFGASQGSSDDGAGIVDQQSRIADLEHSFLTRNEVMVPLNLVALLQGDTADNIVLQPGDVLTVPRRALIKVYAQGEVHSPGRQILPAGSTVLDLLNAAGGATSGARLSRATMLRMIEGKPTSVQIDLGRLVSRADASQNLMLQEGDVLTVPAKSDSAQGLWRWLPFVPYLLSL